MTVAYNNFPSVCLKKPANSTIASEKNTRNDYNNVLELDVGASDVTTFQLVKTKCVWKSFSSACAGGFAFFLQAILIQALFNPSLSDLELLKPIINSYFLFRDHIVALVFPFFFPSLPFPVQKQKQECKDTWSHQAQTYAFLCSLQGLQVQTQPA